MMNRPAATVKAPSVDVTPGNGAVPISATSLYFKKPVESPRPRSRKNDQQRHAADRRDPGQLTRIVAL